MEEGRQGEETNKKEGFNPAMDMEWKKQLPKCEYNCGKGNMVGTSECEDSTNSKT